MKIQVPSMLAIGLEKHTKKQTSRHNGLLHLCHIIRLLPSNTHYLSILYRKPVNLLPDIIFSWLPV